MPDTGIIVFASLLFVASVLNLVAEIKEAKILRAFSKPLLMPLLLGCYLIESNMTNLFIVFALLAAFAGDAFLILQRRKTFFMLGLVSFLLCNFSYIIYFIRTSEFPAGIPWYFWFLTLPFLLTGIIIYMNIRRNLGNMEVPVIIYIIVILFMSFLCAARIYRHEGTEFWLPLVGSLLFIASDTLLAFNSFRKPFKNAGFFIMLTYITAQIFIVMGIRDL